MDSAVDAKSGVIGIIAGNGRLPVLVAESLLRRADAHPALHLLPIRGVADDALALLDRLPHTQIEVARPKMLVRAVKKHRIGKLILAGGIHKRRWWNYIPDLLGAWFIVRNFYHWRYDNALLSHLMAFIEAHCTARFVGIGALVPELMTPVGVVGRCGPIDEAAKEDIKIAYALAQALGVQDIGQAVVVRDGKAVAYEDARGTANMLATLAADAPPAGIPSGVLAKALKPGQDMRADLPSIGVDTIVQAAQAGLAGVVLTAGRSIIIDKEATIRAADERGLFVMGLEDAK